jgi:hypothetical protein
MNLLGFIAAQYSTRSGGKASNARALSSQNPAGRAGVSDRGMDNGAVALAPRGEMVCGGSARAFVFDVYRNDEGIQPRAGGGEGGNDAGHMDSATEFVGCAGIGLSPFRQGSAFVYSPSRPANRKNHGRDCAKDRRDGRDDRDLREKAGQGQVDGPSDSGTINRSAVEEIPSGPRAASHEADSKVEKRNEFVELAGLVTAKK